MPGIEWALAALILLFGILWWRSERQLAARERAMLDRLDAIGKAWAKERNDLLSRLHQKETRIAEILERPISPVTHSPMPPQSAPQESDLPIGGGNSHLPGHYPNVHMDDATQAFIEMRQAQGATAETIWQELEERAGSGQTP